MPVPSIYVKVDASYIQKKLDSLGEGRQLEFATSLGLNKLANKVQEVQRQGMESRFTLNRAQWNLKAIKINKEDRATKGKLSVTITIDDRASYLNRFEDGDDHIPFNGRKYLAIPSKLVFGGKPVMRSNPLHLKNLHLKSDGKGKLMGSLDTFLVNSRATGTPVIIQRLQHIFVPNVKAMKKLQKQRKGWDQKRGTRLLYTLVKRSKVPAKLEFVSTAQSVVDAYYQDMFDEAIAQALNTKK